MRSFIGFVIKEFYHIIRDYRSLIILFAIPAVDLVLFGYTVRNELTRAPFAVVDPSRDQVTTEIVQKLASSHYLEFEGYLKNESDIDPAFKAGKIKEVVVFDRKFAHKLTHNRSAGIQLIADASNPNMGALITAQISGLVQQFQATHASGPPAGTPINIRSRLLYNPDLRSVYLFVPGLIAVILMLISALMTSITIAREKETGSMEILLASPLRPIQIIIGKVVPYFFLAFIDVLIVIIIALSIFNVPFRGSVTLFLCEAGLFELTALSLGLLISSWSESQQTAMMTAQGITLMPTFILSGLIFPISSMPRPLQWLSTIIPARWFLVIVRGIMLKGIGIEVLWKETAILAGMAFLFLFLSLRAFKVRLD